MVHSIFKAVCYEYNCKNVKIEAVVLCHCEAVHVCQKTVSAWKKCITCLIIFIIYFSSSYQGEDDEEDFRTIPIYPTPEEFHQDHRPFLRPNLTSQRYTNAHLYLDTHFRLLREDFVRPLREGIQQLLQNQMDMGRTDNPMKTKRIDDIRVYFDTQLVVPKCTQTGLSYIVQFNIQQLKVSMDGFGWIFSYLITMLA